MTNKKYDLDFYQALKIVLDGGAVKGENFMNGIFLKLDSSGRLVIVDAGNLYAEDINVYIKYMTKQKYRELSILTMKELSS